MSAFTYSSAKTRQSLLIAQEPSSIMNIMICTSCNFCALSVLSSLFSNINKMFKRCDGYNKIKVHQSFPLFHPVHTLCHPRSFTSTAIINHSKSDPPHNTFLYNMSQDDTSFSLEPPDDNATDHILTEEPNTSDTHNGWLDKFCKELGYRNLSCVLMPLGGSTSGSKSLKLRSWCCCITSLTGS